VKVGNIAIGLLAIALVACIARDARAQTPNEEQSKEDLREVQAVSKRHRAELMKIPHVSVVTAQIDSRNEAEILVEVDDPKNVDSVMREVPSQIEGFPVEVGEHDSDDESVEGGITVHSFGTPAAAPPPTIDKNGYYHHTWIHATKPDAAQ
jgi:hypothetical protein